MNENQPYITVVNIYGTYCVNRVEYDKRQDSYVVVISREKKTKAQAILYAIEWAKRERLEYRP